MQKDYWNLAKRNFQAVAIASLIPTLIYIMGFFNLANSYNLRMDFLKMAGFSIVAFVVLLIIASLFKKRSPKAITVGYIYLTLSLVLNLVNYFILNSPADFFKQGIVFKILVLLIIVYLFDNVHKASKQGISQPSI